MLIREMIDTPTTDDPSALGYSLPLLVGCEFGLESVQPANAILQVAPRLEAGVSILSERWDTNAVHHSYADQYGNRCERFDLATGASQIAYEAELLLACASDLIEPDAPEVPVALLPDDVLTFVMP